MAAKKKKTSTARKTSTDPTRIWKSAAKIETPDVALDILRKASRYYNKRVEIERARYERYVAIRRVYAPELAVLEDQWTALDDQIVELYREAKRERQQHWVATRGREPEAPWRKTDGEKRRILPPAFEARKEALKERQKEVSESAKELRAAFSGLLDPARKAYKLRTEDLTAIRVNVPTGDWCWNDNGAEVICMTAPQKTGKNVGPRAVSPINARVLEAMLAENEWHPAWKEIARSDDVAHKAVIEARARCGLYGGTYLGVEEAFERAKKDSSPRPPGFHSFSGGGRIRVQLKNATWATVNDESKDDDDETLRLRVEPIERREGFSARSHTRRGSTSKRSNMVRVTLDQKRGKSRKIPAVLVSAVCKLHRLPPADAAIKWLALVVRRVGRRTTCQLQLTLEHPNFAEPKRPSGTRASAHIRLGWSRVDDGIRVATGLDDDVVCPDALLGQQKAADHIESVRDKLAFEAVRRMKRTMARAGYVVDGRAWQRLESDRGRFDLRRLAEAWAIYVLGNVRERWIAWRIVRKRNKLDLYAPTRELRAGTGSAREAYAWWCFLWAKKDAHLEQYIADMRRRFPNRRDAHYRQEAIRIATEYESVTIDNYEIDELKKLEPLTMPGTGIRAMAQSQLQDAAPGRFREILIDVMGGRCTPCARSAGAAGAPCARPGDGPKPAPARGKKGKSARAVATDDASAGMVIEGTT